MASVVMPQEYLALQKPLAAQNADDAQQFQKLAQVFRYLSGLYVDDVEMKPIVEGAITGMLEELDPHSAFLTDANIAFFSSPRAADWAYVSDRHINT